MRIAVLGLGSAGSRHARNLVALGHEVVGFDPAGREPPDGVAAAADEHEALARSEAVVVASPSANHAAQALTALRTGRHVLVEKPLATDRAAAEAVGAEAERSGLVCAVAMNLRFHPALRALRSLVAGGELGRVLLAEAVFGYDLRRWRPGDDYRAGYSARADLGGGIVLDAIHELDYLLWLLGPVATVAAETAHVSDLDVDVEDVGLALLRFRSGALATVSLNFFEPAYRRGCILVGSDAVARWSWSDDAVEVARESEAHRVAAPADLQRTYVDVVSDFVDAVSGARPPRAGWADGVAAVRLADALKRAAAEGRRIKLDD